MDNKENYIFLDVETGGLVPSEHSLLQIGYIIVGKDGKKCEKEICIKKDKYSVTPFSLYYNGIVLKNIYDYGISESSALLILQNDIKHFCDTSPIVVGHNVGFDVSFMKEAFKNARMDYENTFNHRNFDTMTILRYLNLLGILPDSVLSSKGGYEHFGIVNDHAHQALDDARCTMELFYKLLEAGKDALKI